MLGAQRCRVTTACLPCLRCLQFERERSSPALWGLDRPGSTASLHSTTRPFGRIPLGRTTMQPLRVDRMREPCPLGEEEEEEERTLDSNWAEMNPETAPGATICRGRKARIGPTNARRLVHLLVFSMSLQRANHSKSDRLPYKMPRSYFHLARTPLLSGNSPLNFHSLLRNSPPFLHSILRHKSSVITSLDPLMLSSALGAQPWPSFERIACEIEG